MMGCYQPCCVPVGPLVGELWHFECFRTWRPSAILNFKNFNIWSRDCHCGPNLLLYTKFQQNCFTLSASRRHNCWMYNAPAVAMATASWGTCRGHDGMWPPKFHPNRSIDRRVIAFPTFCNMAAVRHLEYEFCYSEPPTKSTMRFDYRIKIWYRSDFLRRRYYNFIILPFW